MPLPTARLQALADLVLPDRPVADIGTDHAALPVELVATGRVPRAIGIDLREGPLAAARETAAAAGLLDDPRLDLRRGDGLTPLAAGEVATVVIAGMGGARILALLRAAPRVRARLERLVLQPNTEVPAVRAGLDALGFHLVDERVVRERGQAFLMLVAAPGRARLTEAERLLGPVLLARRSPDFLAWLASEEQRLDRALASAAGSAAGPRLARELELVRAALAGGAP